MKKCPKCSRTYDDSWGICLKDSEKLVLLADGEAFPPVKEEEFRGVGGWLGIYIWVGIISIPISILMVIFEPFMAKQLPPSSRVYSGLLPWYGNAILASIYSFDLYARIMLLRLKPKAVRMIKIVLLLLVMFNFIFIPVAVIKLAGPEQFARIYTFVMGILSSAIWYAYFSKSKRVKNTYVLQIQVNS